MHLANAQILDRHCVGEKNAFIRVDLLPSVAVSLPIGRADLRVIGRNLFGRG
jgi:hypothetical protein